jgi:hypothetical protein
MHTRFNPDSAIRGSRDRRMKSTHQLRMRAPFNRQEVSWSFDI